MFLFHVAISLALIALASGAYLYSHSNTSRTSLAKGIGIVVMIFSIISILCTSYYGIKYWKEGYFDGPMGMRAGGMMRGEMMGMPGMMNQHPDHVMMEKCMMNCKNMMSSGVINSTEINKNNQSQEHTAHHQ